MYHFSYIPKAAGTGSGARLNVSPCLHACCNTARSLMGTWGYITPEGVKSEELVVDSLPTRVTIPQGTHVASIVLKSSFFGDRQAGGLTNFIHGCG